MLTDQFLRDAFKCLPAEKYDALQIAIAKMRLQNAIDAKQLRERLNALNHEYAESRRDLISDEIDRENKKFNDKQRVARQLLSERDTHTKEESDNLKAGIAKLDEDAFAYFQKSGIDFKALVTLRDVILDKAEQIFSETAGKGMRSVAEENASGATENDPELDPPYKLSYDVCEPPDRVRSTVDRTNGVIEANMRCSLRDCGESESQTALYRNYWIFGGQATASGRITASIDLQPIRFRSIASVRDNNGNTGVSINRSFRVFAQLNVGELDHTEFPNMGGRAYWSYSLGARGADQIISRPTCVSRYPDYYECMPFSYKDEGLNIDSFNQTGDILDSLVEMTGIPIGDNTWRYTVAIPDEIRQGQLYAGAIGIEFYNRVWGDDATVYSELDFEFRTPRIAWEIV